MHKPINGYVLAPLIIVWILDMGYALLKAGALTTVQAKLSMLSASSASEAPDTASFLSQMPASGGGSVKLARLAAGIPPHLFVKQINQERGFNPHDVSSAGAEGIVQFMPETERDLGIYPWDPVQSLQSASQLKSCSTCNYHGDYAKALAAYNGGTSMPKVAIGMRCQLAILQASGNTGLCPESSGQLVKRVRRYHSCRNSKETQRDRAYSVHP